MAATLYIIQSLQEDTVHFIVTMTVFICWCLVVTLQSRGFSAIMRGIIRSLINEANSPGGHRKITAYYYFLLFHITKCVLSPAGNFCGRCQISIVV
jgi:hypothetical protein